MSTSTPSPNPARDDQPSSPSSSSSSTADLPNSPTVSDPDSPSSSQIFTNIYGPAASPYSSPFPAVAPSSATLLATKFGPSLQYYESQLSPAEVRQIEHEDKLRAMPEKCFSFCTQSEMARPLCRMLCFRKRAPVPTREEHLARLSGRPVRHAGDSPSSGVLAYLNAPFERLHKKLQPHSIIYVRGTADGVIMRYMEELEWDDGMYDFKGISRGTTVKQSWKTRGEDMKMEKLDWEEHGALVHIPLTSLFYPILSLPNNLSRLFSPSFNFLSACTASIADGAQLRLVDRLVEQVQKGGASEMLSKISLFLERRAAETREKRDEMMKQRKERMGEVGKEVGGKGEER